MTTTRLSGERLSSFVGENASQRLKKVASQVENLLKAGESDDTVHEVHQFRVATRRYRAVLDTFRELFPAKGRRQVKTTIRSAFSVAGEVRNRDIVLSLFEESRTVVPAATRRSLRDDRKEYYARLYAILETWNAGDFTRQWRDEVPMSEPRSRKTVGETARSLLPDDTQLFFAAGRNAFAKGDPESLHQFRIAAKKFRYALELFRPLYGPEMEERLASLKRLQDFLGSLNDLVTARSLIPRQHSHRAFHSWMDERELAITGDLIQYWQKTLNREGAEAAWIRYFATSPHAAVRNSNGQ